MASRIKDSGERQGDSRSRILDAALREFSALGLAGARTDRIAERAGVNKALLYYYYGSKEKLYAAALELIATRIRDRSMAVLTSRATAGERLLRAALDHFDRILAQEDFQSLLQQEMMRLHRGEPGAMAVLVKNVFGPVQHMYESMVREGMETGELIEADWMQIHLSALGANVFYFLSAPVWRMVMSMDPLATEALAARRKALVEFLGQAVFRDRRRGAELAARVLADMPMPEVNRERLRMGRKDEREK